jgi:hypothetical protein
VLLEVIYIRSDGVTVKTLAFYSYRHGPIGEWMIGDTRLDKIDSKIVSLRILPRALASSGAGRAFTLPRVPAPHNAERVRMMLTDVEKAIADIDARNEASLKAIALGIDALKVENTKLRAALELARAYVETAAEVGHDPDESTKDLAVIDAVLASPETVGVHG